MDDGCWPIAQLAGLLRERALARVDKEDILGLARQFSKRTESR